MKTNMTRDEKYNKAIKDLESAKALICELWGYTELDSREEKRLDDALDAVVRAISRTKLAAIYNEAMTELINKL